jgi:hypothetical protein
MYAFGSTSVGLISSCVYVFHYRGKIPDERADKALAERKARMAKKYVNSPVKASSGNTRRSRSLGAARWRTASARLRLLLHHAQYFCASNDNAHAYSMSPTCGANCKQPIRILTGENITMHARRYGYGYIYTYVYEE